MWLLKISHHENISLVGGMIVEDSKIKIMLVYSRKDCTSCRNNSPQYTYYTCNCVRDVNPCWKCYLYGLAPISSGWLEISKPLNETINVCSPASSYFILASVDRQPPFVSHFLLLDCHSGESFFVVLGLLSSCILILFVVVMLWCQPSGCIAWTVWAWIMM